MKNRLGKRKKMRTLFMLGFCMSVLSVPNSYGINYDDETEMGTNGNWEKSDNGNKALISNSISIWRNSQYLTIQDSNPVNTITVKITSNETGATVFENVYPQGQTSFIVIPMNGWSAGSYTIELFGRENNGYLWGTFQVLP